MARFGEIHVDGKTYELDNVSLGDMKEVENLNPRPVIQDGVAVAGLTEPTPFSELNFGATGPLIAVTWVILRRTEPEITLEDVEQKKLIAFLEPDEEVPETGPPTAGAENGQDPSNLAGSGAPDSDTPVPGSLPGISND
jgi:hypothetical protein